MGVNGGLYALDERMVLLEEKIASQGFEMLPEDLEALESSAEDGRSLADQLAKWWKNAELRADQLKAQAKVVADEAARLKKIAASEESSAEFAKSRLIWLLDRLEMRSLRTSLGTASVCKASQPKVVVEGEIPEGFRKQKVEWVLDREAVLEAESQGCLPDEIRVERNRTVRLSATKEEKIHADAIS